jgi:PilZ domain
VTDVTKGSGRADRKSPRIELYAQAHVRTSAGVSDVAIMAVRNVSAGGIYLEGTPEQYPQLKPSTDIELVIFGSEEGLGDAREFNIVCRARVIRIDPGFAGKRPPGFGVTIEPIDEENRDRLTNLLLRAAGYRAGNRP